MATEGGGKIKPKRGHSSSKPYQRRKSLLGKVTDTVKDLFAPSWLTDFVSTVSKKTPPKDRKDALLEEEEEMFSTPTGSPAQLNSLPRRSYPVQQDPSTHRPIPKPAPPSHTITSTAQMDSAGPSTSSAPQQPTFSSFHLPFSKFTAQKTRQPNDDAMSERSDISRSTSGCSSLIPHPDRQAYQREILQLNDSALEMLKTDFQQTNVFKGKQSISRATHRPTQAESTQPSAPQPEIVSPNTTKTWTADRTRQGRSLAPAVSEKPSFNTSLFGSPVLNQSSSILGGSFGESSFYSGKTTFGGASAYRKLNQTAPYQTALPIRKQLKTKPLNTSLNAVTSSTARRILETLERMSTPLSDAKKIPANESSLTDSVLSFTPGSYRRRPSRSFAGVGMSRKSLEVPVKGPPTSMLKTPSIASISKNRQKLYSSTPTASRIADSKSSSTVDKESSDEEEDDDEVEIVERPSTGGGKGGKMKRGKSYRSRPDRQEEEEEEELAPPLKTDFTLPVANMPAFNFNAGLASSRKEKTVLISPSDQEKPPSQLKFTFSSPIQKSGPKSESQADSVQGFKFSSPLKINEKGTQSKSIGGKPDSFKSVMNSTAPMDKLGNGGLSFGSKAQLTSIGNGENFNSSKGGFAGVSSGGSFQPAGSLKQGSVMDVLGGDAFKTSPSLKQGSVMDMLGKDSSKSPVSGFTAAPQLKSGSVMDVLGKDKSKPAFGGFGAASSLKSGSVMDILGGSSSDSNSMGSAKPSSVLTQGSVMDVLGKKTEKSTSSASGDDLMAKFRKPAGNWDCDTCLVQNKGEVSKCVACGTSKPGAAPALPPPAASTPAGDDTSKPASSGGTAGEPSLLSVFKPASGAWNCDICLVQNKGADTKCVACETPKPGTKPTENTGISSGTTISAKAMSADGFKISGSIPGFGSSGSGFGQSSGGGFGGFGSSDSKDSGFKMSGQGFSFGKPVESGKEADKDSSKPSGGFQFGVASSESKPEAVVSDATSVKSASTESRATTEAKSVGFGFGQSTTTSTKDTSSSEKTVSTSGFTFGQNSDSTTEKMSENVFGQASSLSSGTPFGFGAGAKADSGFSFGAPDASKDTSKTEAAPKPVFGQPETKVENKPAFGMTSSESKPASSLFTFGQPVGNTDSNKPLGSGGSITAFSANTDSGPATKRGRDEETEAPSAKKSFTFGQSSSAAGPTGGFNFGSSATVPAAAGPFTFGASAATTENKPKVPPAFSFGGDNSASTAPATTSAPASVFAFGAAAKPAAPAANTAFQFAAQQPAQSTGTSSVFQFGGQSTTTTNQSGFGGFGSAPTTTASLAFGTTNSLPQPAFGNTANSTPQAGATGGTMFGSSANVFGSNNSASSVPAFGSAPDQNSTNAGGFGFNSQTSGTVNSNAGGFGFGSSGSGGVFQFAAKNSEASAGAPAQGATTGFGFGSAQQPQPAAPAPSFNSTNSFSNTFTGNTCFSMGSNPNPDSGRKIKRAVRKIRK